MAQQSIAERMREELEEAWKTNPDDPWYYVKFLATKVVAFVDFNEKAMRALFGRIRAIEEHIGMNAQPQAQAPQGQVPAGDGQQQAPQIPAGRASGGPPGPGWVRLDAMGNPCTPEEQAAEEKGDLSIDGKIDVSRYVPADQVLRQPSANGQS